MTKHYHPTPDVLQGDTPIGSRRWFESFQWVLVKLANTDYGRDLLCLDPHRIRPYPVVSICSTSVKYYRGRQNGRDYFVSDFRTAPKWGNVIRYRWREFQQAIDRVVLLDLLALPKLVLPNGKSLQTIGGAATTTVYPNPHTESTSVDAAVERSGVSETFSAIRAGAGVYAAPSGTVLAMQIAASSTTNRWKTMTRSILLFDASAIGDSDNVDSATLEFVATTRNDQWTDSLSVVTSTPASNTNVVAADFAQLGTTKQATDVTFASLTVDSSTYSSMTLNATGIAAISLTGVTKLGIRCTRDNDNSEPSWESGQPNGEIQTYSADQTGTSADPKLVIVHSVGFTPKVLMF